MGTRLVSCPFLRQHQFGSIRFYWSDGLVTTPKIDLPRTDCICVAHDLCAPQGRWQTSNSYSTTHEPFPSFVHRESSILPMPIQLLWRRLQYCHYYLFRHGRDNSNASWRIAMTKWIAENLVAKSMMRPRLCFHWERLFSQDLIVDKR